MPSRRAWTLTACLSLAAAIALLVARPLFVLPANPQIHVRWEALLGDSVRAALERQLQLVPLEAVGEDIWRYELTDSSRTNIEAIVGSESVADTHYIDRDLLRIVDDAPRAEACPGAIGAAWPAVATVIGHAGPPVLLGLGVLASYFAWRPAAAPVAGRTIGALLTAGIPAISPRTLALFRLILGAALAWFAFSLRLSHTPLPDAVRVNTPLATGPLFNWLGQHFAIVAAGQWASIVAALFFAAGVLPRLMFLIVAIGITQWLVTITQWYSSHPFGVLILPLLCLIAAPWGDAPPIWRPMSDGGGARAKRYGYAPWILCLALGVAWAGAAWAKVGEGPAWVLNGTIRYHFVTDIESAPYDWGLRLAAHPSLSVALSAGAVAVEGLSILGAFVRSPALRLVLGLGGAGLLLGFNVFMGLFWLAWWIPLLGFLPWEWLDRRSSATPILAAGIGRVQGWCAGALIAQQAIVSAAWWVDVEPISGRYDMYSQTYGSTEQFDRQNPGLDRRIVAVAGDVTLDVTECARNVGDDAVVEALRVGTAVTSPSAPGLAACVPGNLASPVFRVVEDQCLFNWDRGEFYCLYRDRPVGTLESRR